VRDAVELAQHLDSFLRGFRKGVVQALLEQVVADLVVQNAGKLVQRVLARTFGEGVKARLVVPAGVALGGLFCTAVGIAIDDEWDIFLAKHPG